MEIDLKKIAEDLLQELLLESDKMKLRAEGVKLLYGRIQDAAKKQDSISSSEEAGTK